MQTARLRGAPSSLRRAAILLVVGLASTWLTAPPPTASADGLPDLTPTSLSAPASVPAGSSAAASFTVSNLGTSSVGMSYFTIRLSIDASFDYYSDREVAWGFAPALPGGASSTVNVTLTIPYDMAGTFYLIAVVDPSNNLLESNEANNAAFAQITLFPPDLVPTALSAPSSAPTGGTATATLSVANAGPGNVGTYNYDNRIFLSTDTSLDASDIRVGARSAQGDSYTQELTLQFPYNSVGTFYLIAYVDFSSRITESNETNNIAAFGQITLIPPDLVPTALAAPASAPASGTVVASLTIANQEAGNAGWGFRVNVYLSADTTPGLGDAQIASDWGTYQSELKGHTSETKDITLYLPYNTAGTFYLIVQVDPLNQVIESNETNNTAALAQITLGNRPPTASTGGPYNVPEGGSVALAGSGGDPDGDPLTYAWDLDSNGSFETSAQNPTFSAAGIDGPASRTPTLQVCDNKGACATAIATVNVTNVAPTIGPITAPVDPVRVGTPINASATFTDPAVADTHTATFDWGDNSTSAGAVTESNGSGSVTGNHTYSTAGVYVLTLTVKDKDNGPGQSVFQYVVVYNPTAGFVTGAGTIDSPAGAYTPNPTLAGKAIFGFVSRYQTGATVPEGQTQFRLTTANMGFASTSYEWLVVAGARAQFKGAGTINGSGNFGFLLTATDGQAQGGGGVDKFRIKIWDKATGGVVYDNQMGAADNADPATAIAGGSIGIQQQ